MADSLRDMVLTQWRGLHTVLDGARITVSPDGQRISLYTVLGPQEMQLLLDAAGLVEDLEADMIEEDVSDPHTTRAIAPDLRKPPQNPKH